jgi:hypothetical protein
VTRLILVALTALALTGCTSTLQDIEGVHAQKPDKVEVYQHINRFPNLSLICVHGVAFITTTRDYAPVLRVPELDTQCPAGRLR